MNLKFLVVPETIALFYYLIKCPCPNVMDCHKGIFLFLTLSMQIMVISQWYF